MYIALYYLMYDIGSRYATHSRDSLFGRQHIIYNISQQYFACVCDLCLLIRLMTRTVWPVTLTMTYIRGHRSTDIAATSAYSKADWWCAVGIGLGGLDAGYVPCESVCVCLHFQEHIRRVHRYGDELWWCVQKCRNALLPPHSVRGGDRDTRHPVT